MTIPKVPGTASTLAATTPSTPVLDLTQPVQYDRIEIRSMSGVHRLLTRRDKRNGSSNDDKVLLPTARRPLTTTLQLDGTVVSALLPSVLRNARHHSRSRSEASPPRVRGKLHPLGHKRHKSCQTSLYDPSLAANIGLVVLLLSAFTLENMTDHYRPPRLSILVS